MQCTLMHHPDPKPKREPGTVLFIPIVLSLTQAFKIDEPQRRNATLRHFQGICDKNTTQDFRRVLVFITLC